jgi:catalase
LQVGFGFCRESQRDLASESGIFPQKLLNSQNTPLTFGEIMGFVLPKGSQIMKAKTVLCSLPMVLSLFAATSAFAQSAPPQTSTPAQLVDALNGVFGKQTDNRAVHAKGVVLEGKFTPSKEAASLSKAPHLQDTAVPVTVRFSDFAGVPAIPDTDPNASPRGMAVKFHLPDGSDTNLVAHSYNGFPTATADEFRQLLLALAASGADASKPTPLEKFFETHPIAKAFLTAEKPAPVSFGTLPYFAVNSFKFTNAKGDETFVRYQIVPEAGAQYLTKEQLAAAGPYYLMDEIRKRVGDGPVRFKLQVQIAEAADKIDDPSIAWPDSRKTVELGEIEIDKVNPDSDAAQRTLLFIENAVPAGIEPADPMIDARSAAYAVSFARRHAAAPQ